MASALRAWAINPSGKARSVTYSTYLVTYSTYLVTRLVRGISAIPMLIKEQLFSAIVIYNVIQFRPIMKLDPTPLILPNFHGPLVTMLTVFHCMQILRYEYLATDRHLVNSIRLCQPETNFHCLILLNSTPDLFNTISYFRVRSSLYFKASLSAKIEFSLIWKAELITITKLSHLDSL